MRIGTKQSVEARRIIHYWGGPTNLARLLGFGKARGARQRVANWERRGIPAYVLLRHPEFFVHESTSPVDPPGEERQ